MEAAYWVVIGFTLFSLLVMGIACKVFPHEITVKEIIIGVVVQIIVVGSIFYVGMHVNGKSTQVLNGEVTSKSRETVSCSHSYQCNCVTTYSGSGKHRTSSRSCSTCYQHSNDYAWMIHSNLNEDYEISKVDSQGVKTPNAWSSVTIGQPFSVKESYYNFIKGSPLSIFNESDFENDIELPYYNQVIGFTAKRVVNFNSKFDVPKEELNAALNEKLKKLGVKRKVNLAVIFHSGSDPFVRAFKAKNYGGEINDVTVLLNVDIEGKIEKVDVFSYSKNDLVNIMIRDNLLNLNKIDRIQGIGGLVNAITDPIDEYYDGRSMKEFEYLEDTKTMNIWFYVGIWTFGLLFPFVWSFVAYRFEITRSNNALRKRK